MPVAKITFDGVVEYIRPTMLHELNLQELLEMMLLNQGKDPTVYGWGGEMKCVVEFINMTPEEYQKMVHEEYRD